MVALKAKFMYTFTIVGQIAKVSIYLLPPFNIINLLLKIFDHHLPLLWKIEKESFMDRLGSILADWKYV